MNTSKANVVFCGFNLCWFGLQFFYWIDLILYTLIIITLEDLKKTVERPIRKCKDQYQKMFFFLREQKMLKVQGLIIFLSKKIMYKIIIKCWNILIIKNFL